MESYYILYIYKIKLETTDRESNVCTHIKILDQLIPFK